MTAYAEAAAYVTGSSGGRNRCALYGHEGYVEVGETALGSVVSVCPRCGDVAY